MVIQRDPARAWLVVECERREIELGDDLTFQEWARGQHMLPNVELKLLAAISTP